MTRERRTPAPVWNRAREAYDACLHSGDGICMRCLATLVLAERQRATRAALDGLARWANDRAIDPECADSYLRGYYTAYQEVAFMALAMGRKG